MERENGIEPSLPAWKAGVLPLNYSRVVRSQKTLFFVRLTPQGKPNGFPMALPAKIFDFVEVAVTLPLSYNSDSLIYRTTATPQGGHFMDIIGTICRSKWWAVKDSLPPASSCLIYGKTRFRSGPHP